MVKKISSRKSKKSGKKQSLGEQIVSFAKTLIGAIIVVMVINGIAVASFVVPTGSMENTVMAGDFLFVNKFIYGPSTPQVIPFLNVPLPFYKLPPIKDPERGDVIVFIFPGNRDEIEPEQFQYYLKRCVAVGGDTIEIKNKKVYVNGEFQELPEKGKYDPEKPIYNSDQWATYPFGRKYTRDNYGPLIVPKKGDTLRLNERNLREWTVFINREGHQVTHGNGMI
ncbi:MAG: signal peptidase I, partial [Bacteroidota bacterium]